MISDQYLKHCDTGCEEHYSDGAKFIDTAVDEHIDDTTSQYS